MNSSPPDDRSHIADYAGQVIRETSHVHLNLEQDVILTTEDKMRLVLSEHLVKIERKKGWIAPLGIVVTIAVVFSSATFRDFIISKDAWTAVFVLGGVGALAWLVVAVIRALCTPAESVDNVIMRIKRSAISTPRPLGAQPSSMSGADNMPMVDNTLRIISATYGAQGRLTDVTSILAGKVSGNRIAMVVSNKNLGGDPIRNAIKELLVKYKHAGQLYMVKVPEGQTLLLPPPE
jgi:hypothetical protein